MLQVLQSMMLEGSLTMKYMGQSFELMVKTVLKNNVYYFFITDKEKGKSLLSGETLELTYSESFCIPEKEIIEPNKKIPADIVSAIENMLVQNKQLWYY